MPIIFAAAVPNHPSLVTDEQHPTNEALKELEGDLYTMKPDTVLVLTSFGAEVPESINVNIESSVCIKEKICIKTDMAFSSHIQMVLSNKSEKKLPIVMIAQRDAEEHVAVPFVLLTQHLPEVKAVVISTSSTLSLKDHFDFGEILRHESLESNSRIAVIAAGSVASSDASRTVGARIVDAAKKGVSQALLALSQEDVSTAHSELLPPLAVLLGAINNMNIRPRVLSDEVLYDQQHVVINFALQ